MNTDEKISSGEQHDVPKSSSPASLKYSETEPAVDVGTCLELDQMLHKVQLRCTPQHPIVVFLHAHGHRLGIGLGLPKSFVSFQRWEPTSGPSVISIGDAHANWGSAFYFHGWYRTEVRGRNALPAAVARQIVREFFETGMRSTNIEWEAL